MESLYDIRADGTVVLRLHVRPGASSDAVVGVHGDALKVRVRAAPEGGRANEAVVALVAAVLGVPAASVDLVSGASSRAKRVAIVGVAAAEVDVAIGNALRAGVVARRQRSR